MDADMAALDKSKTMIPSASFPEIKFKRNENTFGSVRKKEQSGG
jgi:hypothetical protein